MNENVYYHPEEHGLVQVVELNDMNADYSFDKFVVWKDPKTNEHFYASDSGCSCPSPFEDFTTRASLTKLDPNHFQAFLDDLNAYNLPYGPDSRRVSETDLMDAERVVRESLGIGVSR